MSRSFEMKYRMENLMDDALNIQKLLPWIESDEDIIDFMRRVPLDHNHLRKQLTIYHFLKKQDDEQVGFEQQIEDDAREIVILLPDVPYKEIKRRLGILGMMPNRKEVVLRQLLFENKDVERVLYEMYYNSRSKRKPATFVNPEESNNSETNINIKIRRVEGNLEVVSSFKQANLSPQSPQPQKTNSRPQLEESDHLTSTSNMSNGTTPKIGLSTSVSLTTAEKELPNPVEEIDNVIENVNSDTADVPANTSQKDNVSEAEKYDLVQYLKEISQADEKKIKLVCQNYNAPLDVKPDLELLNVILNAVFDEKDVIVVEDGKVGSISNLFSPADKALNEFVWPVDSPTALKNNSSNNANHQNVSQSLNRVIIAPARLVPGSKPSEPLNLSSPKKVIVQPAKLLPQSPKQFFIPEKEQDEIPALPQQYLHRIANNASNLETHSANVEERPRTSSVATKRKKAVDEKLVFRLLEMFPEACPGYIRNVCEGRMWAEFDDVVTVILSNENYPKRRQKEQSPLREVPIEEQLEIVKALLPDADPTYLRCKVEDFGNDQDGLNEFILQAKETKSYPTMKEYLRKQKLMAQSKQYTCDFSVENFVQLFPEPQETFNDPKRTVKVDNYTSLYILNYFQNRYDMISVKNIRSILSDLSYRIVPSNNQLIQLVKMNKLLKNKRKHTALIDIPQNIAVLQELAYLTHQQEIETYIKNKKEKEMLERQFAKNNNLMNTCRCCFDDEVMPKDTFHCPRECVFCRDCILRSCEVAMGEGKTEFKCLDGCDVEFTLQTLQNVLPPKMFSKLAQKKTVAEVQAAGIAELESCPFCDFATIPNENDKIFYCLNADCMKESCRLCQQENHIPYKCDEVERDADVKARTYVENKMTEALLRKCWKCGLSFFKEEGCNKMTCTCGAQMCYICQSPVRDYSHFNGIGGDKHHLCPLYSDSNAINQQNVMGAAQAAKAEIDPAMLKVDPTVDIQQHYEERKKVLPREGHLDVLDAAMQQMRHIHAHGQLHQRHHPGNAHQQVHIHQLGHVQQGHVHEQGHVHQQGHVHRQGQQVYAHQQVYRQPQVHGQHQGHVFHQGHRHRHGHPQDWRRRHGGAQNERRD